MNIDDLYTEEAKTDIQEFETQNEIIQTLLIHKLKKLSPGPITHLPVEEMLEKMKEDGKEVLKNLLPPDRVKVKLKPEDSRTPLIEPLPDFTGFRVKTNWIEQEESIKAFRAKCRELQEQYYDQHKVCPACKGDNYSTTYMGFIMTGDVSKYIDENEVECSCGWKGIKHDLIAK